jgi:hypothetical protein
MGQGRPFRDTSTLPTGFLGIEAGLFRANDPKFSIPTCDSPRRRAYMG